MRYIFSSLLLLISIVAYAETNSRCSPGADFELVLSDFANSVDHYSKGKIYLKPDMIIHDEGSLWLTNDSAQLEIPFLYYDASGYYITYGMENQFIPWYKCTNPHCGRIWDLASHHSTRCPKCNSPGKLQGS